MTFCARNTHKIFPVTIIATDKLFYCVQNVICVMFDISIEINVNITLLEYARKLEVIVIETPTVKSTD